MDGGHNTRRRINGHMRPPSTTARAPPLARDAARPLDDELPVALQCLSVHLDLPTLPQVADHVPVDGGLVEAARLGIRAADGEVDGATDLLVEQDLPGAVGDAVVGPDPELAEAARAIVGVEHLDEELLALLGARVDDPAALEPEPDPGDLATRVTGR